MKRYPGPHGPYGDSPSFAVTPGYSLSCLWEYDFWRVLGMDMGPIPSLTFPID